MEQRHRRQLHILGAVGENTSGKGGFAMFREAFNKVQKTGSNRDFGTTKAARMYFSLSEPSPADSSFAGKEVNAPSFKK